MARPVKWRRVEHVPTIRRFAPAGKATGSEISLKLEELEALRLKDLEGLEQEACAVQMEVSRPTFQRILSMARAKVADSLVNGKAILIEGGHFTRNICQMVCPSCGNEWDEAYENMPQIREDGTCPSCGHPVPACQPDGTVICREGQCQYRCGPPRGGRGPFGRGGGRGQGPRHGRNG